MAFLKFRGARSSQPVDKPKRPNGKKRQDEDPPHARSVDPNVVTITFSLAFAYRLWHALFNIASRFIMSA